MNWVYYVSVYSIPEQEFFIKQNYFIEMFGILRHWTSGKMGWWQIYPIILGIVLLLIRTNIDKFISDFNLGYVDEMSDE